MPPVPPQQSLKRVSVGGSRIDRQRLLAPGLQRILIPTVYRENYLAGLRALSGGRVEVLPRVLDFAQRYSRSIEFTTVSAAETDLARTHAFLTEPEAEAEGVRLMLPR